MYDYFKILRQTSRYLYKIKTPNLGLLILGEETIINDAQRLFLTLHLGINPSNAQEMVCGNRDQAWVGCVQGKRLTCCSISLMYNKRSHFKGRVR